ncbi:MAG: hypothetical protein K2I06_06290 [Ruminococcus sp.]|nr:hypothetical protein [Ruminococcus sp.]
MHDTEDYDKNETCYADFTKEQAEKFVKKANLYGFFGWQESYERKNIDDGKGVDICIKFKDGSVHETYCYEKFPLTYNLMAEVFYETFGYHIL